MVFSSIPFLCFFLVVFSAVYFLIPNKLKMYVLLVFSLFFYAYNSPLSALILLGIGTIGYVLTLLSRRTGRRKLFLALGLAVNLGLLLFFKLFGAMLGLATPPGLSFFIFSSIAYCIDTYRDPEQTEQDYFCYLCYITMFPKLLSGPIVRYSEIRERLHDPRTTWDDVCEGGFRFLLGLFKKVLLADALGRLFAELSAEASLSMAGTWLAMLAFTLQLFLDFSSYSDMAIGLGRMMGFTFKENFNYPYTAVSLTDFWRRWHISLSSFFRDYVYIPLGGNRKGTARTILNLLIVWMLTGFWHGTTLNFILWGLYYGVLLILEKFVLKNRLEKWPEWLRHAGTMLLVMFGWCLFAFTDAKALYGFLAGFIRFETPAAARDLYYLKNYGAELAAGLLVSAPWLSRWLSKEKKTWVSVLLGLAAVLLLAATVGSLVRDSFSPFLYFNF